MSNPKVRSLGRRGGQIKSEENGEVKKKGSYTYQVDDETKDIVKSLFEEYASDDGKNFYTGNRDERAEKEHEDFINEVDKQLEVYEPEDEEDSASEETVVSPLKSKLENKGEASEQDEKKPEKKAVKKPEKKPVKEPEEPAPEAEAEAAAAEEPSQPETDKKTAKIREKRVSLFKNPKKAEASEEAPEGENEEAKADKKQKTKNRKAAGKMKKKPTTKNEELYDEYEDGYDEYDDYEDAYDDDYEDDYDDDGYEDDYEEPKRSGGGVEFSLKIVSLTIVLVIVLLIMTALFINNRSLSRELQEVNEKYEELSTKYSNDVTNLLSTQGTDTADTAQAETQPAADTDTAAEASDSDSDSDSDSSDDEESGDNYYVVQSGDTLYKIASSELGDSSRYKDIMDANDMTSTTLSVGDKLIIPDAE